MERHPVLLVPGWSDTDRALRHALRFLVEAGWPETYVSALRFRDRFGSNYEHAREIAAAAQRLLEDSGRDRIDLVAHSMGGLASRFFLHRLDGWRVCRRAVFLGSPHRGTWIAWLAWGAGGAEMRAGSPFLTEIAACETEDLPVEFFTVRTPLDLRIFPGHSAVLPRATNHRVWCPTHQALLRHRRTLDLVLRILRD